MSELSYKELQEKGIFDIPSKAFQYMQEQQEVIDEITQALIKEQEEVLKYKPIYLNLIAENVVLTDKVKGLKQALEHISHSTNKSISYEHDLFDKGWNQCAKRVVDSIYKLTGIGSNKV